MSCARLARGLTWSLAREEKREGERGSVSIINLFYTSSLLSFPTLDIVSTASANVRAASIMRSALGEFVHPSGTFVRGESGALKEKKEEEKRVREVE